MKDAPAPGSPRRRRRTGNVLLVAGILAWVPFVVLLLLGRHVSILPFLAVHLAGVLTGSWLRRSTGGAAASGLPRAGRRRLPVSNALIVVGVAAWIPYFYGLRVLGHDVGVAPYLAVHLSGVLVGGALRLSVEVQRWRADAAQKP